MQKTIITVLQSESLGSLRKWFVNGARKNRNSVVHVNLLKDYKTMPKEKLPSGVLVCVHPKGWMDENLVKKWLDDIWFNRPNSLRQQKSLLVWDMFRAHLCDSVKRKLSRKKCRQAVIPGGCTSVLQPLDVCLNKPFKTNMRKRWNEWMINGDKEFTPSGNMKRPSIPLILSWIRDAWHDIPSQMIVKSFKKCCISNAMDGSEDDALYSDLVKPREANGADDENEQTPDVISDDAQPDTFDELDNLYDDLYDDLCDDGDRIPRTIW